VAERPIESRREELDRLCGPLRAELDAAHAAREQGLAACRRTIRACGSAIRAVHRLDAAQAAAFTAAARDALHEAQRALAPHPRVAHAGFLHDAEAASELRRHLLDRIREGDLGRGEQLLGAMEDAYELLVTVDYPDPLTGGLRRATDALRAVLERSRGDVTTTAIQTRLRIALEQRRPPGDPPPP